MVSETEVIGSLNRLAWGGVNTFTSYYNISHLPKEQHIRINEQIGRVNTIMAEGHSAADIAVLYPAATPLKHAPTTQARSWRTPKQAGRKRFQSRWKQSLQCKSFLYLH